MAKDILHVVPHDQAWAVRREGNERVSSTHPTQKEAIDAARELAKEQDDIVIHRADGTIREHITYYGETEQPTAAGERRTAMAATTTERAAEADPRDWMSVGSRVSWGAVLAGAVIALATYIVLTLLALAIGLSAGDRGQAEGSRVAAAVTAAVILLIGMFVGGYIASRATAGEQPAEAAAYGVLVWGATLLLLLAAGMGSALGFVRGMARGDAVANAQQMQQRLNLTEQQTQQYTAMLQEARGPGEGVSAQAAAWWSFAGVALSLLAAVGGGLLGAGPELVLRKFREDRGAVVAPRPA
jgi:hypothetical protein